MKKTKLLPIVEQITVVSILEAMMRWRSKHDPHWVYGYEPTLFLHPEDAQALLATLPLHDPKKQAAAGLISPPYEGQFSYEFLGCRAMFSDASVPRGELRFK